MLKQLIDTIPQDMIFFLLTVLFSLLIGLEQRRHHNNNQQDITFGTDRTFTLIGVLGFVLYILDKTHLFAFFAGGLVLAVLLWIFYAKLIDENKQFGFTSLLNGLVTYCLAPLIYTQPSWMVLLIVVTILVITELKDDLMAISQKFDPGEFITLAKFLALAGVILPLLPNKPIYPGFSITPYHFWMSIVVVSGISYLSYLLQKFVFPKSGLLLTGLLGGLYSSTATVIILARKSKENRDLGKVTASMMLSIAMMYIRVFVIAYLIKSEVAMAMLPSFAVLTISSFGIAWVATKYKHIMLPTEEEKSHFDASTAHNPLEFKTALVFGVLFIFFAVLTHYVLNSFGNQGLNLLAMVVGVTDIDPFILSLLQGKWTITAQSISAAILIATNSNNLVKLIYSLVLGNKLLRKSLLIAYGSLILVGITLSVLMAL